MKKLLMLLLCLAMILSCVACGGSDADGKEEEEKEVGAEVPVYLSTPIVNFDPAFAYTDEATTQVLSLLYMGLTVLDENGKVKPGLAEEWEIIENEEENEYAIEFTLKENVGWSDGTAVTSTDFVYAWTRLLDPTFTSEAAALLFDISNARAYKNCDISSQFEIGIIPLETDILRVEFDEPIDYDRFLVNCSALALAPVAEDYVIIHEDWATNPTLITTCGPFTVRRFKAGENLILERNTYYLRGERDASDKYVRPKSIIIDLSLSAQEQLQKFEDDAIVFMGYIPLDSRSEYQDDKRLELKDTLTTHTYYFNTEKAPFDNVNVRTALSLAISRTDIATQVVFAKAAEGFLPEKAWNTSRKNSFREEGTALISGDANLAKAQELINAANLSGEDKKIDLVIRPNEVDQKVASIVKTAWESLGFQVNIVEKGTSRWAAGTNGNKTDYDLVRDSFREAYYAKEFDVIAIDQTMLTPDPMSLLQTYAMDFCGVAVKDIVTGEYQTAHMTGYHSPAYDDLIEQAYVAESDKERAILLHKAEEKLVADMPAMPIFVYQNAYLIDKDLKKINYDYAGTYNFIKLKLKNFEDYLTTEE